MQTITIQGLDLTQNQNVLLICPDDLTTEDAVQLKGILQDKFPNVHFTILAGEFKAVTSVLHPPQILEIER